jgi:hypothetical protein
VVICILLPDFATCTDDTSKDQLQIDYKRGLE